MKKKYGFQKTHLELCPLAQKAYDDIDPINIYEDENGLYTITGAIEKDHLTSRQVNELLIDYCVPEEEQKGISSMKKSEAIKAYASAITETMRESYRDVLESEGRVQYQIYVWEDGDITRLPGVQGDNSYLKPHDWNSIQLFYVTTVSCPNLDLWDCADHSAPEDQEQRESEEQEIIDYLMDEYDPDEELDKVLEEAKREEAWEENNV